MQITNVVSMGLVKAYKYVTITNIKVIYSSRYFTSRAKRDLSGFGCLFIS